MIDLTLEVAERALRAAQARAKALGAPMTVAIVDEAGRLVLCARGDGTGFFTTDTARAKAVAAAAF
ncbi:MAG TPA: heme-binding protein, partial [Candidatus Tectomicrobia bacterium]|nr:heme-binding protein [Candidatus Tectomicrobia bacterium]